MPLLLQTIRTLHQSVRNPWLRLIADTLQHLSKLYQNQCPACSSGTDGKDVFVFHLKPIWYFQTCRAFQQLWTFHLRDLAVLERKRSEACLERFSGTK